MRNTGIINNAFYTGHHICGGIAQKIREQEKLCISLQAERGGWARDACCCWWGGHVLDQGCSRGRSKAACWEGTSKLFSHFLMQQTRHWLTILQMCMRIKNGNFQLLYHKAQQCQLLLILCDTSSVQKQQGWKPLCSPAGAQGGGRTPPCTGQVLFLLLSLSSPWHPFPFCPHSEETQCCSSFWGSVRWICPAIYQLRDVIHLMFLCRNPVLLAVQLGASTEVAMCPTVPTRAAGITHVQCLWHEVFLSGVHIQDCLSKTRHPCWINPVWHPALAARVAKHRDATSFMFFTNYPPALK